MDFLQGFSECAWPGPGCTMWWEAWAAVAGGLSALSTVVIGVLAWRTAEQAKLIAERQQRSIEEDKAKQALVRGRLLINEVGSLPTLLAHCQNKLHIAGIGPQGRVMAFEHLNSVLHAAQTHPLPLCQAEVDSLHLLPDDVGSLIAQVLGEVPTMEQLAGGIISQGFTKHPNFMVYGGRTSEDFVQLSRFLDNYFELSERANAALARFVGIESPPFDRRNYLGPIT